jgi:hypothetical protein
MVPENKQTEDTNKLTLLAFKIIILHNTRLATFIKLLYGGGNPTTCDSCSAIDS